MVFFASYDEMESHIYSTCLSGNVLVSIILLITDVWVREETLFGVISLLSSSLPFPFPTFRHSNKFFPLSLMFKKWTFTKSQNVYFL